MKKTPGLKSTLRKRSRWDRGEINAGNKKEIRLHQWAKLNRTGNFVLILQHIRVPYFYASVMDKWKPRRMKLGNKSSIPICYDLAGKQFILTNKQNNFLGGWLMKEIIAHSYTLNHEKQIQVSWFDHEAIKSMKKRLIVF